MRTTRFRKTGSVAVRPDVRRSFMINRDDMLELTRRMTPARNCFSRIAGAYMDAEGYEDGTFNIHCGKLSPAETRRNLEIAKAIPFSRTNEQLKEYRFAEGVARQKSLWPVLMALKQNRLKDDALLGILYEVIGENYHSNKDYSIFVFHGSYDIPVKGTDREWLEGSEEVYDFIICAISLLIGKYEPGEPEFGFLFPAFSDRSGDDDRIDIFWSDPNRAQKEIAKIISSNNLPDNKWDFKNDIFENPSRLYLGISQIDDMAMISL